MKGGETGISRRSSFVSFDQLSCSTICFRSYLLCEALDSIRSIGFTHVDIGALPGFCAHFDFTTGTEADDRERVRVVRESGLQVHTFTTDIGQPNDREVSHAAAVRAGRRNLAVANELGATGVVFNCGVYRDREEHSFEGDMREVADVLRPLAEEAVALGLRPMIEAPHKYLLCRTPEEARQLVDAVGVPEFKPILDINHYAGARWKPRRAVDFIGAQNIGIVHLRDAMGRENRHPLGAGDIDFSALFDALLEGGYTGRLSFEFSETSGSRAGDEVWVRQSIRHLESLCG